MKTVQVTGNFDNWAKANAPLTREAGTFKDQVWVDKKQKIVFKFVLNGTEWVTSEGYKKEFDGNGIENNYIDADELVEVEEFEQDAGETNDVSGGEVAGIGGVRRSNDVKGASGGNGMKEKGEVDHIKDNSDALTATLSFAAISTNDSTSDSKYEHVVDAYESPQDNRGVFKDESGTGKDDEEEYDNGNQFDTPTNSVVNSYVLSTPTDTKNKDQVSSTADTSVSNIEPSSQRVSTGAKQPLAKLNVPAKNKLTSHTESHKDEIVEILKVPGSFPSPTSSETNSSKNYFETKPPVKRETLISRFKSLFKP